MIRRGSRGSGGSWAGGMDIRLDANEAWPAAELIDRVGPLAAVLSRRRSSSRCRTPRSTPSPSCARGWAFRSCSTSRCAGFPDAEAAVAQRTADLLNVRLSKCGGILPSLRIIGLAQRSGLGVQLGCHPGETSLLSAAGRHVASRVAGLRYVEGSYDRHILAANLTRQDLTFGYGGRARPVDGPGLGVEVDPAAARGDDRFESRDPL